MQMWTWLSRAPLELVHLVTPHPRALRVADLDSIDAIVCDCDGVLFHGTKAIAGVPEAIAELRRRGKQILFVTNAATQSRASLATKLKNLGYAGVDASHCVTSASAAASFLHTNCSGVRSAYVVGEKGLVDELALVGIEALGANDTGGLKSLQAEKFDQDVGHEAVGAVVVGMLSEGLCYARLAKAAAFARDKTRPFVATNPDSNFPAGVGGLLPAGGACVAFVACAADRPPDIVVGKPSKGLSDVVTQLYGLRPGRTLMVGDRCNTDILFGNRAGFRTLLVLSGCHTLADADAAEPDARPDFVAGSLADVLRLQ